MLAFDPWAASFDDARAAQDAREFSAGPTEPIYQWDAVQRINARKLAVDNGNGFAVLACIRDCVTHGLIAPEWLAYDRIARYNRADVLATRECWRRLNWETAA